MKACFIKNEGNAKITDLSIQDSNDLWDGLRNRMNYSMIYSFHR